MTSHDSSSVDVELLIALVASGAATTADYDALLLAAQMQPSILEELRQTRSAMDAMMLGTAKSQASELPEEAQFAAIVAKYERSHQPVDVAPAGAWVGSDVAVSVPPPPAFSPSPRGRIAMWVSATAAIAAVAATVTWGVGERQRQAATEEHQRIASGLQVRCALAEDDRATAQAHAAERELLLTLMSSPASKVAVAKSEQGAELRVFYNASAGQWVIAPSALAALPADKDYQLWLIADSGAPIPAGLLAPDRGPVVLPLPSDPRLQDPPSLTAALSIEPRGGSASPTMDQIVMMSKLL